MIGRKDRLHLKLANDFEVYYSQEQLELKARKDKRLNIVLELIMGMLIIGITVVEVLHNLEG